MIRNVNSPLLQQKFRLHPLIHTWLEFALVQDAADIRKAEPKLRMDSEK